MTTWYEGTDDVDINPVVNMAANDILYVAGGVKVGCSQNDYGVTSAGLASVTVYGELFSAGARAFEASGGSNNIYIGAGGSVSGRTVAIALFGSNNSIINDGSISGTDPIYMLGGQNSVINSGHIGAYGLAIHIMSASDDHPNTIDNSGTIASFLGHTAIDTGAAATTITNSGHIAGNIDFGIGNDTYDGALGTIAGRINGGGGHDLIVTGPGNDVIAGGPGPDTLEGGGGHDRFVYSAVSQSTGTKHDTLVEFDFRRDWFDLNKTVTGIDATISHGQLRAAHFNHDLGAAVKATTLHKGHAVIFKPTTGNLAGHIILVVDANGHAGYQTNADYVFDLKDPVNLGQLTVGDFI